VRGGHFWQSIFVTQSVYNPASGNTPWTRNWDDADDEILMMCREANVSTAEIANWFGVPEQEVEERINVGLFLAHFCRPE
jgi:hypothetical protein